MHTPAIPSDAMPLRWAAELMKRLRALYGVKFDQAWGNLKPDEIPALWADQLAGLTGQEIAVGLAACRDREWPPTIPEFRRLCRPWTDPEVGFYVSVKAMGARRPGQTGEWPHPALYWAAVSIGAHDLANCAYSVLRGRWEAALSAQLAHAQWDPIPAPSVALPAPGQTVATREEAAAALRKMGALGIGKPRLGGDGRDWARTLLANPKGKSPAIIDMAKRALANLESAFLAAEA